MSFYTLWFLISVFLKFDLDFNLSKETYFNIYEEKRNFEIYTTFKPLQTSSITNIQNLNYDNGLDKITRLSTFKLVTIVNRVH